MTGFITVFPLVSLLMRIPCRSDRPPPGNLAVLRCNDFRTNDSLHVKHVYMTFYVQFGPSARLFGSSKAFCHSTVFLDFHPVPQRLETATSRRPPCYITRIALKQKHRLVHRQLGVSAQKKGQATKASKSRDVQERPELSH